MLVFQQHIFHIGYFTPVILSFAPIFPSDTHPRKGKIIKETKYLTLPRDCCPNQGHWVDKGLNCANLPFLRYLCFLTYSGVQHIWCCVVFCFSSSCVPYVASFSGLSFFIVPSAFSNIYLSCVLCTLWCQFLWLSFFIVPSAFSNIYLSCVLCTLCCQFLWIVLFYCPFGIL
jgi:hypothetical protein